MTSLRVLHPEPHMPFSSEFYRSIAAARERTRKHLRRQARLARLRVALQRLAFWTVALFGLFVLALLLAGVLAAVALVVQR